MADGLLFFKLHLGEGAGFAIGHKQRVVSESHVAYGGVVDGPATLSLENAGLADAELAVNLRDGLVGKGAEVTGPAVLDAFQLFQKQVVVAGIVAVAPAVTGAVDSRFAVQGKDFQAGVVGQDGGFDAPFHKPAGGGAGLDDGVFGKGLAVFYDVAVKPDIFQGLKFVMVGSKDMGEVSYFTGASGSDDEKVFHRLVVFFWLHDNEDGVYDNSDSAETNGAEP